MRILQGEGYSARGGILQGEEFCMGRNSARGGILQARGRGMHSGDKAAGYILRRSLGGRGALVSLQATV